MNAAKAEEVRGVISARFPDAEVVVTPHPDGAEIRVSIDGDRDRNFKIDDDELDSPIIRLLVGAAIAPLAEASRENRGRARQSGAPLPGQVVRAG
jgi:hypothetical protein